MLNKARIVYLDVFMAIWGLGTWLGVNGMYVQLPLLVDRLPEQWALPTSMALVIQLANIGPLAYTALRRLRPSTSDSSYIITLLILSVLALFLNSGLYNQTVIFSGSERSVAFLTLTFVASLVGCTSSVLFYPYLRHFRDVYLVTYLIGEGLSGFLPSILALMQGVGGEPTCVPDENGALWPVYPPARFSITVFMVLLGLLAVASLISFIMLDRLKVFASERIKTSVDEHEKTARHVPKELEMTDSKEDIITDSTEESNESLLQAKWLAFLTLGAILNAIVNGVLPSVQTYSCKPYGTTTYHLAVTLGAMANPTACLAGIWLRPVSTPVLGGMLTFVTVPFAYILTTALLSPNPPLQNDGIGVALVVISWVLTQGFVSYARMWTYDWARRGGARGMRALGAATQVGSAVGSLLLFVLVNYTLIFTPAEDCPAALISNNMSNMTKATG